VPDVYATIADAPPATVAQIAGVLEVRAADAQQAAMRAAYLGQISFSVDAEILEVGCGTGAVARDLASRTPDGHVVGLDPSPVLLEHARELGAACQNLRFEQGDAHHLPFEDGGFDVVIFHTALCHIPGPEIALAEAFRVLRGGGWLAVFDGDYATTTVATGDLDPLQPCAAALIAGAVHDPWLVRRLPRLVTASGFTAVRMTSHGYVETQAPDYLLTVIDRGADMLEASGRIGDELAATLKAEARRRVAAGEFFGVHLLCQRGGAKTGRRSERNLKEISGCGAVMRIPFMARPSGTGQPLAPGTVSHC
jgi:SAM-dependent methyltransferase